MQRETLIRKSAFNLAWVSWAGMLLIGITAQHHTTEGTNPFPFLEVFQGLLLNVFILSTYFYTRKKTSLKGKDFSSLLGRVFLTALVTTAASGILTLILVILRESSSFSDTFLQSLFFHLEFGLFIIFLSLAFATWRKMALFERSRFMYYTWLGFEYFLLASLLLHFFRLGKIDVVFSVQYGFFIIWILVLSFNVRWVPQLNFNQKLFSIFQLGIILFCLAYFFFSITAYFNDEPLIVDDISKSLYATVLFSFIVIYSLVSLLVILFNLPTSSAFEKKFRELNVYQQMSDHILEGKNEEAVFSVLLDSAFRAVKADAGWLEARGGDVAIRKGVTLAEMHESGKILREQGFDHSRPQSFNFNRFKLRRSYAYDSVLALPLFAGSSLEGTMVLMRKLPNAFDRTMLATVNTFVAQAGIAVQNFRLLSEALDNERFKNEIKIAKGVQERLLPKKVSINDDFELVAFAESAREVGGDYYDFHKISDQKYGVIIADVSGKSIPAAFNMAQMKGIFHTLVRLNLNPDKFMVYANAALSSCLEKSAFITASYFFIDTAFQKVYYSRAGHCPALYQKANTGKSSLLDGDGLGLGILRDDSFENFVKVNIFDYEPGDVLMLFTDGLIEARSPKTQEQYGYERLQDFVEVQKQLPINELSEAVVEDVYGFADASYMEDDFTLLTIRF